jgi:glycine/D-amino acid oxidase-like deaminating enzyme
VSCEFDVIIAGGGAVGSACAYFLSGMPEFRGSVAVVEPDPTYRGAASARSASSIRRQFSTPVNIALSAFGIEFLRDAPRLLSRGDVPADVGLIESSYLYLATSEGRAALEHCVDVQQSCGVPVTLRTQAALATRYPWLNTADLSAGSDTATGEGWFDGFALLTALRRVNEDRGVRYLRDRVVAIDARSSTGAHAAGARPGGIGTAGTHTPGMRTVVLEQRGRLECRCAVIAAGTRARELALTAGVDLPVYARKRCVFVFTCPQAIPDCPLIVDPSGLWFRPERDRFLCGLPADPDPDVAPDDFEVEPAAFEDRAWPILAHRVPAFEAVRLTGAWAGHYDYNTFDQNAFVGPVPNEPDLLIASGFSGHGLQQAPGVGRALAELIVFGEYRSLDLRPLSFARFPANAPLKELIII